jgi:drug/metabolite transporter (DMT)-like permease
MFINDWFMNLKKKLPYVYWSVLYTPIFAIIALLTTGAGHGTYFVMKILYPYTMLSTFIFNKILIAIFFAGLLQYLFYGIILTIADKKGAKKLFTFWIAVIHFISSVLCFVIPNFMSKPYPFNM